MFQVLWNVYTDDGEMPFEAGKTYLLRGFYIQPSVHMFALPESNDDPVEGSTILNDYVKLYMDPYYEMNIHHLSPETGELAVNEDVACSGFMTQCIKKDSYYYQVEQEGQLPFYTEYTGDVEDFLVSPEGKVWAEEIIPLTEANHSSATVLRTDRAESIYAFSSGDAYLLEGRMITSEEYAAGSRVCLISATYARVNGLSVGDKLEMELHNTKDATVSTSISVGASSLMYKVPVHYPLTPETALGTGEEYEIVGIYSGTGFNYQYNNLDPNVILIPKNAVVLAEEDVPDERMYTIVLENGSTEAFEAELEALGYGGYYEYYDHGYAEALAALQATKENAQRLLLAGIGILLLDAMLFFFLLKNRLKMAIRSMMMLGQSNGGIRRQLMSAVSLLILLAAVAGSLTGAVLFGTVSELLFSQNLSLEPVALLLCGVAQLALLLLLALLWTGRAVKINLMQKSS